MADQANESARVERADTVDTHEQSASESQKPTRRPRKKAGAAPLSEEVSHAVAESLAALKSEAPKRTTARKSTKAQRDAAEALLVAIPTKNLEGEASPASQEESGDQEGQEGSRPARKKAAPRTSRTRKSTARSGEASPADAPVVQPPLFTEPAGTAESTSVTVAAPAMTALLFQEPDVAHARTRRRRTSKTEVADVPASEATEDQPSAPATDESAESSHVEADSVDTPKRRRGSRGRGKNTEQGDAPQQEATQEDREEQPRADRPDPAPEEDASEPGVTRRRRRRRTAGEGQSDEVAVPKGSTRLEAKRQRRKEGRDQNRRRHTITESEYLARRESVKREMLVREQDGLNQIAVLEDDVLVEHYVARHTQVSMVGNVYLGRVQNVLPSMEAAFVDIGKGRNAVLYAGEVNWEAAGLDGKPRRIEQALQSGDTVLVQVTKDPIGQKGARLTAQITLAGRHLVLVPSGAMTGISRKLPDRERQRLKKLLREIVPPEHGVIVRTAAEGATEEQLRADVERLTKTWEDIQGKSKNYKSAPTLLKGEPELAVRVVRDIFNEDFTGLTVQGNDAWKTISEYVGELSPELSSRLSHWTSSADIFAEHRVDEQLAKAFDRKVWLPSGGTLVIDRTEAMTVIDVNTGKFTGAGGTLEETVTRNNLEAAEEIVRQLRLRDIGGIIVVDFIDMVLESNRELVLRRLIECLGRDRTRHQVAEVTSLGLVQMTRKRVGQGLVEAFSTPCEACEGRGFITHTHPVERNDAPSENFRRNKKAAAKPQAEHAPAEPESTKRDEVRNALNSIAAAAAKDHDSHDGESTSSDSGETPQADLDKDAAPAEVPEKRTGRGSRGSQNSRGAQKKNARRGDKKRPSTAEVAPSEQELQVASVPSARVDAPSVPVAVTPRKKRRVSSSGTITPGSGSGAILSFPAEPAPNPS